jgi:hypothetical protein
LKGSACVFIAFLESGFLNSTLAENLHAVMIEKKKKTIPIKHLAVSVDPAK